MITTSFRQDLSSSSTAPLVLGVERDFRDEFAPDSLPTLPPVQSNGARGIDTSLLGSAVEQKKRALAHLRRSEIPSSPDAFRVSGLEKWTGRVLDIDDELFTAELVPANGRTTVIADFNRSQIAIDDDVIPGDVIYVTVRTVRGHGGLPNRTSSIRLRRLGNWTAEDIAGQRARAAEMTARMDDLVG